MGIIYKVLDKIHLQVPHGLQERHQKSTVYVLVLNGLAEVLPQKSWLRERGGSAGRGPRTRDGQHQPY